MMKYIEPGIKMDELTKIMIGNMKEARFIQEGATYRKGLLEIPSAVAAGARMARRTVVTQILAWKRTENVVDCKCSFIGKRFL